MGVIIWAVCGFSLCCIINRLGVTCDIVFLCLKVARRTALKAPYCWKGENTGKSNGCIDSHSNLGEDHTEQEYECQAANRRKLAENHDAMNSSGTRATEPKGCIRHKQNMIPQIRKTWKKLKKMKLTHRKNCSWKFTTSKWTVPKKKQMFKFIKSKINLHIRFQTCTIVSDGHWLLQDTKGEAKGKLQQCGGPSSQSANEVVSIWRRTLW